MPGGSLRAPGQNVEIRPALGHRFVTWSDGDDRCIDCGWKGQGLLKACRPESPRCDFCESPSNVTTYIGGERFERCSVHTALGGW